MLPADNPASLPISPDKPDIPNRFQIITAVSQAFSCFFFFGRVFGEVVGPSESAFLSKAFSLFSPFLFNVFLFGPTFRENYSPFQSLDGFFESATLASFIILLSLPSP